ncbi:MAG: hypothetical protein LBR16_03395, partial [Treponema sp.]|nr:hypothetical protein [Treponema sp.]
MKAALRIPGPESVWKILQEVAQGLKELKEAQAEAQAVQAEENLKWQKLRESQDRIDRQLEENSRQIRESQDKTDRLLQETALRQQETDRQMQETDRKLRESQERTDKRISRLGNRIGDLIELFAAANVIEKFQALGFEFTQASQNMKIQDKSHN